MVKRLSRYLVPVVLFLAGALAVHLYHTYSAAPVTTDPSAATEEHREAMDPTTALIVHGRVVARDRDIEGLPVLAVAIRPSPFRSQYLVRPENVHVRDGRFDIQIREVEALGERDILWVGVQYRPGDNLDFAAYAVTLVKGEISLTYDLTSIGDKDHGLIQMNNRVFSGGARPSVTDVAVTVNLHSPAPCSVETLKVMALTAHFIETYHARAPVSGAGSTTVLTFPVSEVMLRGNQFFVVTSLAPTRIDDPGDNFLMPISIPPAGRCVVDIDLSRVNCNNARKRDVRFRVFVGDQEIDYVFAVFQVYLLEMTDTSTPARYYRGHTGRSEPRNVIPGVAFGRYAYACDIVRHLPLIDAFVERKVDVLIVDENTKDLEFRFPGE